MRTAATVRIHCRRNPALDKQNISLVEAIYRILTPVLSRFVRKQSLMPFFNTNRCRQFTSEAFTNVFRQKNIATRMDGKVRSMNDIFIERIWRNAQYKNIYLNVQGQIAQLKKEYPPVSNSAMENDGTKTLTGRHGLWLIPVFCPKRPDRL